MTWWHVVLVVWMLIAFPAGTVLGSATRTADRRERGCQAPLFVPEEWSLTPSS
jgi:hypothetical protein